MEKISVLSYCIDEKNIYSILKDGYIKSLSELGIKSEYNNGSKIGTRLHIKDDLFHNWYGLICLLLDKSILEKRKDYFINFGPNNNKKISRGITFTSREIQSDFNISIKHIVDVILKLDLYKNEVVFSKKISLNKYLKSIAFLYNKIWSPYYYNDYPPRFDLLYKLGFRNYIEKYRIIDVEIQNRLFFYHNLFIFLEKEDIPFLFIHDDMYAYDL